MTVCALCSSLCSSRSSARAQIELLRRENAQLQAEKDARRQQESLCLQLEQMQLQGAKQSPGVRQKLEDLRRENERLRAQAVHASMPTPGPLPAPRHPYPYLSPAPQPRSGPSPALPGLSPSPPAPPCKFFLACMDPLCSKAHPLERDQAVGAALHPFRVLRRGELPSALDTKRLAEKMHSSFLRLQSNQLATKVSAHIHNKCASLGMTCILVILVLHPYSQGTPCYLISAWVLESQQH